MIKDSNLYPDATMDCSPFLQRLGYLDVRPRQGMTMNFAFPYFRPRSAPVEYPNDAVENIHKPHFGLYGDMPYGEEEIRRNSNFG
ncbi:MAG: hypothetical protein LBT46_00575 [Planctomycetaceae bacterium]|jgi:hypothetical protein|nr:hypothetical protein [Planctomycetaceae bacterium]